MKSTSLYCVAYLDLLGTTKKIVEDENDKYLNIIDKAIEYAIDINKKITKSSFIEQYQGKIKTKAFSDNIIMAIPIKSENEKLSVITAVMEIAVILQSKLILECEWLSRGAITIGDLYIDENFVWGNALVRAYDFESNLAVYPRVIIDPEIMKYYNYPGQESALSFLTSMGLDKSQDELYHASLTSVLSPPKQEEMLEKLKRMCDNVYDDKKDYRVIQKHDWLRKTYLNKTENQ